MFLLQSHPLQRLLCCQNELRAPPGLRGSTLQRTTGHGKPSPQRERGRRLVVASTSRSSVSAQFNRSTRERAGGGANHALETVWTSGGGQAERVPANEAPKIAGLTRRIGERGGPAVRCGRPVPRPQVMSRRTRRQTTAAGKRPSSKPCIDAMGPATC